jgi:hypothetical protein
VDFIRESCEHYRQHTPKRFAAGNWHFEVRLDSAGDNTPMHQAIEIIDAPPGFPERPYLLCEHIIGEFAFFPLSSKEPIRPRAVESATWNGTEWMGTASDRPLKQPHVYFLAIDWTAPPAVRLAAFAEWMKNNPPPYSVAEKLTGLDPAESYRAKLRSLAVYRLVRKHKTVHNAMLFVSQQKVTGQFPKSEAEWRRELTKARKILDEWTGAPVES